MKLAINGGAPIRKELFPEYKTINEQEIDEVLKVIKSGVLSQFLGTHHDNFNGGPQIRMFENEWAEYFEVKHAISVNSCTSGLICAVGALDIEPGDEVICSPYTMIASATAPLFYGAIPVFADVEKDFFCLDIADVERKITNKTRAIIAVDIFGQPISKELIDLAKKRNLAIIEDCAQSPGAKLNDVFTGKLGDVGVFSLNYHKHIHTGEGGVVVTDNDHLAERIRLIRNHAEAVVGGRKTQKINNLIGFNFRLTEIQAAIGREQLKKLSGIVSQMNSGAKYLIKELSDIPGISGGKERKGAYHAYYALPLLWDQEKADGISRKSFIQAVAAELQPTKNREKEGPLIGQGYVKPLYLEPCFQQKIAFGSKGYPFNLGNPDYSLGSCPVVEDLHFNRLFSTQLYGPHFKENDYQDVIKAFYKVWENRKELYQ